MSKRRVLRFVVTGALLGGPLVGCGGNEPTANEPYEEPAEEITANEPVEDPIAAQDDEEETIADEEPEDQPTVNAPPEPTPVPAG